MMKNFNFYINVDQCLNMSNFDIFFYQLQCEQRFHLSDVQFYEEKGEHSLKKAFQDIRIYMDKNPFLIQDFRLIFGIRTKQVRETEWKGCILYRLLKIYYGLLDSRIFIKSGDHADKNVSVIMVYDADFRLDEPPVGEYDLSADVLLLMNAISPDWNQRTSSEEINQLIKDYLDSKEDKYCEDEITRRFLEKYLSYCDTLGIAKTGDFSLPEEVWEENYYADYDLKAQQKREVNVYNRLYNLIAFAKECVGHYCVFRKAINGNNLSENLLALLGVVDYITSDFDSEIRGDKITTNETLRALSIRNWKKADNDAGIQRRYGIRLYDYKNQLRTEFDDMERRNYIYVQGKRAPEFQEPGRLEGKKGLNLRETEEYQKEFGQIIEDFMKGSLRNDAAEERWKQAYRGLKEKAGQMEESLRIFAEDISVAYKEQMEERKIDFASQPAETVYSQKDIKEKQFVFERKKKNLLEKLKSPRMNSSLKFQDQLNFEYALEKCNQEVSFYVKCQKMIRLSNLLLTILLAGGMVLFHYLILQYYVFTDETKLLAFVMYTVSAVVLMVLCWSAPYQYFRKKIKKSIEGLKGKMDLYIRGYFEKAENFQEYINLLNELDSVSVYLEKLSMQKKDSVETSRKFLWHKLQIQEHIRKCSYFDNLIYSINVYEWEPENSRIDKLDLNEDVIHNRLYWPELRREERHD